MRVFRLAALIGAGIILACQARAAEPVASVYSAAAESAHVICSGPCAPRSGYVTIATAVSGFLMAFNATSAPGDGAVTPVECIYVSGPGTVSFDLGGKYEMYKTGMTVVFSTTGCFTKTASATAFFKVEKQ